ncbi:MAG: PT domain-containing protein [Coriobacteriia bacterium]|nr:PT domain-containing protein [Coriobacteriia bacterium]MCL2749864.1 PT domain-containing protein [Coriobacteriia bacterium]
MHLSRHHLTANLTTRHTASHRASLTLNLTASHRASLTAKPTANLTAKPTAKPTANLTAKPTAKPTASLTANNLGTKCPRLLLMPRPQRKEKPGRLCWVAWQSCLSCFWLWPLPW